MGAKKLHSARMCRLILFTIVDEDFLPLLDAFDGLHYTVTQEFFLHISAGRVGIVVAIISARGVLSDILGLISAVAVFAIAIIITLIGVFLFFSLCLLLFAICLFCLLCSSLTVRLRSILKVQPSR